MLCLWWASSNPLRAWKNEKVEGGRISSLCLFLLLDWDLHHLHSWFSSLHTWSGIYIINFPGSSVCRWQILGLLNLYNHMSPFLIINLIMYIHIIYLYIIYKQIYIYISTNCVYMYIYRQILFLWRTVIQVPDSHVLFYSTPTSTKITSIRWILVGILKCNLNLQNITMLY